MNRSFDKTLCTPLPSVTPNFEIFGNYILLKKLASGGMAEVFLARPSSAKGNGRVLVIKRILPHIANDPAFVSMFHAEVQTIMGFNHPNAVHLHDFGEVNHQPYIAMEYIEGKNLREVFYQFQDKKEMIPVPMVLSLIAQAAAGLGYAHTFDNPVTGEVVNAIHRDLSPHNLLVTYSGNVKVIDFGIAKAKTNMTDKTQTGTIKGKVGYLSPEQIQGMPIDARADLFSLAIVAWELLTLRRLFLDEGDSDLTVMRKIEECNKVPLPSLYNPSIPKEVDALLTRALRRNPAERPVSAAEFQAEIRQIMRTHYPTYAYTDTGVTLKDHFKSEISAERKEINQLNSVAQKFIISMSQEVTRQTSTMNHPGVLESLRSVAHVSLPLELRLANIEKMSKQKATFRHYAMFGFFLVALVILKLDDHFAWVDNFLGNGEMYSDRPMAASHVTRPGTRGRKPASSTSQKKRI